MRNCAYCGRSNEDTNLYCHGCGVGFANNPPVIARRRAVLSWFPRTGAEWTRSFAYPLFGCCFSLLIFATGEGIGDPVVWRYAGPSIAGVLLPLMGIAFGLASLGPGLSRGFRITALTVAALTFFGGILSPALAE